MEGGLNTATEEKAMWMWMRMRLRMHVSSFCMIE